MTSPPTFDLVPRINNKFLKKHVTGVMRSIANMYEFDYKLESDTTEKA